MKRKNSFAQLKIIGIITQVKEKTTEQILQTAVYNSGALA